MVLEEDLLKLVKRSFKRSVGVDREETYRVSIGVLCECVQMRLFGSVTTLGLVRGEEIRQWVLPWVG